MAEISKKDLVASPELGELENIKTEKSDSFVIDIDTFSHSINKDHSNANSRIALQRSLSRKGSQRGGDKKANTNTIYNDRDTALVGSSPEAAGIVGSSTLEKAKALATQGSTNHSTSPQVHHQIIVTTGAVATPTAESKYVTRRNSFRRSSWGLDPKRVLFFFATLSSMGTILLIYFTLSITKQNGSEHGGDWQQK